MKEQIEKLTVPVSFETKPQEDILLTAFLFTRDGKLLSKTPVESDSVTFETKGKNLKELRLFIAPSADKKIESVTTLAELDRYKPYEPLLSFDARGTVSVLPIPDYLSKLWWLRICRIRGRVIKNFSIGHTSLDKGICNARVHICEVDRIWWWIRRIPDEIILRIPEMFCNRSGLFPFQFLTRHQTFQQ